MGSSFKLFEQESLSFPTLVVLARFGKRDPPLLQCTMTLTVNFCQSRTRIAAIMLADSIHGYKVPGKQEMDKTVAC